MQLLCCFYVVTKITGCYRTKMGNGGEGMTYLCTVQQNKGVALTKKRKKMNETTRLSLVRFACWHDAVTGRLFVDGQHVADTLENARYCLPPGQYRLVRRWNKRKRGYELVVGGVPLGDTCGVGGRFARGVAVGESPCKGFLIHTTAYLTALHYALKRVLRKHGSLEMKIEWAEGDDIRRMEEIGKGECPMM